MEGEGVSLGSGVYPVVRGGKVIASPVQYRSQGYPLPLTTNTYSTESWNSTVPLHAHYWPISLF